MFSHIREPYVDTTTQYFGTTLPNAIYGNDKAMQVASMTATPNTRQTRTDPVLKNEWIASNRGSSLDERQTACEMTKGSQFDHLVSLANSVNPSSTARCGWIYNSQDPSQGRGAFGTVDGPFKPDVKGQWMWDLNAARQKYHTALCNEVTSCGDLDYSKYKGKCGWCITSGRAVPIYEGKVAYPYTDPCSASSLIQSSSSCPTPPRAPGGPGGSGSRGQCDPLPNGRLPRDCLIAKVQQVGCSETGALVQALKGGSDIHYLDTLPKSYTVYQERAMVGLNTTALDTGKLTVAQALDEFTRVSDQASSSVESGLRAAARDLCLTAGAMDAFDFCTELSDATRGPFSLDCLQKEFLRAGGQKTGSAYPIGSVARWNEMGTWRNVRAAISDLRAKTTSADRATQEDAMSKFYGIRLEKSAGLLENPVPGVEIFWFTNTMNDVASAATVFLGRRIRATIPFINQSNDLQGVSNRDDVSMVFFTALSGQGSAKFRVTSDDGFGIQSGDGPLGVGYKNGVVANTNDRLVALGYFPPTTFTTTSQWSLQSALSGLWFQGRGGLYFKMEMQDSRLNTWSEIPATMLSLVQEAYAPMMSFEVYRNPELFGADFNFADKRMGAMKMKWTVLTGTPGWIYASPKASVRFRTDSSMRMVGSFKMHSFMTMTIRMTFNALPMNVMNMEEYVSLFGSLGKIAIRVYGSQLCLYSEGVEGAKKVPVMNTVKEGVPYLLVLRVLRSNPDIYSVYGLSLGIVEIGTDALVSSSMTFTNPRNLSNPDTNESRSMVIGNGAIDVTWVRMFDYALDEDAIRREMKNTWQYR